MDTTTKSIIKEIMTNIGILIAVTVAISLVLTLLEIPVFQILIVYVGIDLLVMIAIHFSKK